MTTSLRPPAVGMVLLSLAREKASRRAVGARTLRGWLGRQVFVDRPIHGLGVLPDLGSLYYGGGKSVYFFALYR